MSSWFWPITMATSKVVDIIGNLNPVRRFFKYLFERIFKKYISREIALSDFKNGICKLDNLPLNS